MAKEGKISPPLSPAPRVMAVSRSFHQKSQGWAPPCSRACWIMAALAPR